MNKLESVTTVYCLALKEAGEAKQELAVAKQSLIELDAKLSEAIAVAKDETGKALYSNADSRKAALLNHPDRQPLAEDVRKLELKSSRAETNVEVARVQWLTERLLFAADKGLVSI